MTAAETPSFVVLTSFPRPRSTTNPYIVQLADALQAAPGVEVRFFSWRAALRGGYDVVHLHWPETWLEGRTTTRRLVRVLLTAMLCVRLTVTRTAVVRTWHNLERPTGLWPVDHLLLRWLESLSKVRIRLNPFTRSTEASAWVTIPHGHYREWFTRFVQRESEPGHIAFVGRIRRYKGVEHLVEVFTSIDDPAARLTVAGLPSTEELAATVASLVGEDDRVTLQFAYVDDASLVSVITSSSLVVLPYRHMHNSGTVLAALSLDRPVLVPDNEVNRALGEEVGPGWVHLYDGELDAEDLLRALEHRTPTGARPDLGAREWDTAAAQHLVAYRAALAAGSRDSASRSVG